MIFKGDLFFGGRNSQIGRKRVLLLLLTTHVNFTFVLGRGERLCCHDSLIDFVIKK